MTISERTNQTSNGSQPQREKLADGSRVLTDLTPPTRRLSRIIAVTVLMAGVFAVAAVVLSIRAHMPRRDSVARIGALLPPLMVVDGSGRTIDAGKAGFDKRTIIVFYSPSCDVCHRELPKLQPFPTTLRLVMINVSGPSSEEVDIDGLQCDAKFYDRDRVFEGSFSMPTLPTILFVDERGVLNDALAGAHQRDLVQNKLSEFARSTPGRRHEQP